MELNVTKPEILGGPMKGKMYRIGNLLDRLQQDFEEFEAPYEFPDMQEDIESSLGGIALYLTALHHFHESLLAINRTTE